jgi:hypothetical protein
VPRTKIARKGFRKAPAHIRERAEGLLTAAPHARHAELRTATYCGPNSAGDRGDWVLLINGLPATTIAA